MNRKDEACTIDKPVQLMCPVCGGIVAVPMHTAVNGDTIRCIRCGHEFVFRPEALLQMF